MKKTIYIFGNCIAFGNFVEDKMTVASHLQRLCNENNFPYKVKNCSNGGNFLVSANLILSNTYTFTENDILILITQGTENPKGFNYEKYQASLKSFIDTSIFHYYDFSNIFNDINSESNAAIFFDSYHMNHRGYYIVAKNLSETIKKDILNRHEKESCIQDNLSKYILYLKFLKSKCPRSDIIIGSIVMNCNPFTLGHSYLVDSALERCDFLYIFILDEDKSYFSFDDRFYMVKINLENYKNVCVVPGSKMVISNDTFPEYFERGNEFITIDATNDLKIFCKYIASQLNIKNRFVGKEPYSNITSQYNEQMKSILLTYGIEVVELTRFAIDNEFVSATNVRDAIQRKDYDRVKKLVSDKTYMYLEEKGFI